MTPSSTISPAAAMSSPPRPGESTPPANAAPSAPPGTAESRGTAQPPEQPEDPGKAEPPQAPIPTAELIEKLQADRLWLLRQIDAGAWPEWRLDLAALERELGELLDRVTPLQDGGG
ncbi:MULTISPECIES: hypothetical protein [Aphanothece]|uniref:hypothetical protein n=1 Tax=Aphanothece TaxID=1121 RepID=UPI00398509ED